MNKLRLYIYRQLFKTIYRRVNVRVSISGFIRVLINDKYLLIENQGNKNVFVPIGGAFKYNSKANKSLQQMGFRQEIKDIESYNDIRGFIKGKQISTFLKWFNSNHIEREDCPLYREISEELNEIGLKDIPKIPSNFNLYKSVKDKVIWVKKGKYFQVRLFFLYDFINNCQIEQEFLTFLKHKEESTSKLILVDSYDLNKIVDKNHNKIGTHCKYLL